MTGREGLPNINAPNINSPNTQVYQPQQSSGYEYTPRQFSATQQAPVREGGLFDRGQGRRGLSQGSALRAPPTGNPYAPPVTMLRPQQGYQAPPGGVGGGGSLFGRGSGPSQGDYSYTPQYTPGQTIESPQWAIPTPQMAIPGNYNLGDIDYNPQGRIYNADGQQIGGPQFNDDGIYVGSYDSQTNSGS